MLIDWLNYQFLNETLKHKINKTNNFSIQNEIKIYWITEFFYEIKFLRNFIVKFFEIC